MKKLVCLISVLLVSLVVTVNASAGSAMERIAKKGEVEITVGSIDGQTVA